MTESDQNATPGLTGQQRRRLRALANPMRAILQVGEAGLSESVLKALDDALVHHELVKVRLRAPENKKAAAAELAERSGAELCGLVGHTVILFRRNPEKPQIELPGLA
jgi:RNA-binding protein